MMNVTEFSKVGGNYYGYYGYQSKVKQNAVNESIFMNASMPMQSRNEVSFKGNPLTKSVFKTVMLPMMAAGFAAIASMFKKKETSDAQTCMMKEKFETVKSSPSTYREKLPTPDYSQTRENFPSDSYQSTSKSGKAVAYTTNGKEDGIVYKDAEGKLRVPNKWDPEHPYEVSDGKDGSPASVIMIYDEAGGDFAVGDPNTIASTYKNPATGELDPLYDTPAGRDNAFEIHKDEVPSAYKMVPEGTEILTKEGSRVVQKGEVVVYDTDGDPYVMPLKNFLKRQAPMAGDAKSQAVYEQLQAAQKNGTDIPAELMAADGNATSPNAKTYKAK